MRNITVFALMVSATAMFSAQAVAAQTECSGLIMRSYVTSSGDLVIKGTWKTQDYTTICNLNAERKGVSPEVCKGWLTQVDAALIAKKQVLLAYENIASCSEIPPYSNSPAPNYMMLFE